jgi:hypothetical protein
MVPTVLPDPACPAATATSTAVAPGPGSDSAPAPAGRKYVERVSLPVVLGANLMCSFGTGPSTLMVLPDKRTLVENKPVANIGDNKPFVNILPFVLCMSLANPITAAQTAAALGVLTPGTCTPVIPAPWAPGAPTALIANLPALTNSSMCMCAYGGVIQITNPGATKELLP